MKELPLGSSGVPTEVKLAVWRPMTLAEQMARETKRANDYLADIGEPLMCGEEIQVWSRQAEDRSYDGEDVFDYLADLVTLPAA